MPRTDENKNRLNFVAACAVSLCAVALGGCAGGLDASDRSPGTSATSNLAAGAPVGRVVTQQPVTTIAFGSCFDPRRGQHDIWQTVADYDPDVFVMLGDNVYGDTEDMSVMRTKWAELDAIPAFAQVKDRAHFLATWDDHDYGVNDGGAEYPMRAQSQQVFLDWCGEPAGTWRRGTPGIHDAVLLGPTGQRVQVVLLDTRYFRGELTRGENDRDWSDGVAGRYVMDFETDATMLGDEQWAWLGQVLREPADVRIIASSIQVVAEDHGFEKWANLPRERARLFDTIRRAGADGVIFLSGDRHRAEISRFDPARATPGSGAFGDYELWDITASAMNRSSTGRAFEDRFSNEINRHGVGQQYQSDNFGTIEIDWQSGEIEMAIRRLNGEAAMVARTTIDQLR